MTYNCLMVFNLIKQEIEKLKVLAFMSPDVTINCIEYGPFDNGHILLGLSDGWLLAYEYPSLKRLDSKQVYKSDEPDVLSPLNLCDNQSQDSFIETQFDKVNDEPYSPQKVNDANLVNNDQKGPSRNIAVTVEGEQTTKDEEEQAEPADPKSKHAIVSIAIDPSNLILTVNTTG